MTELQAFRSEAAVNVTASRALMTPVARSASEIDEEGAARSADALANAQRMAATAGQGSRAHLAEPVASGMQQALIPSLQQQLQRLDASTGMAAAAAAHQMLQGVSRAALGWSEAGPSMSPTPTREPGIDGRAAMAVLPTGERIALPTQSELDAARGLFDATPTLSAIYEEAAGLEEGERLLQFDSDPRFAYMLLLISMLMRLVAGQREQGAAMLQYAERSVQAMGRAMISGSEERRTGAWVGLGMVVGIGAAGVGMAGAGAYRAIGSVKHNQAAGTKVGNAAAGRHRDGVMARQLDRSGSSETQSQGVAQNSQKEAMHIEQLQQKHMKAMSQAAVLQQGGATVNGMSQSSAQVATAEYDIKAAEHSRDQEVHRNNSEAERKTSDNFAQQGNKVDEQSRLALDVMRQVLQAEADARDDINRKIA